MGVNIEGKKVTNKKVTNIKDVRNKISSEAVDILSKEELAALESLSDRDLVINGFYTAKAHVTGLAKIFGVKDDKTLIEISKDFLELRCTKQHTKPVEEQEVHRQEVMQVGEILGTALNVTYELGLEYNKIFLEILNNKDFDKSLITNFIDKLTKLVNESDKDMMAHFIEKFENNTDEVLLNKILQEHGLEPIELVDEVTNVTDNDIVKPETLSESERLIKEADNLINNLNKEVDDTVKYITEDVNKIIEENISSVNNINTSVSSGDSSDSSNIWKYVMYGLAVAATGYGLYKAYEYFTDDSLDDVVILSDTDMFDISSADF